MKKWTKSGRTFIDTKDKTVLASIAWDVSFYPGHMPPKTSSRKTRYPAEADYNFQVSKDFYLYSDSVADVKRVINTIRAELQKFEDQVEAADADATKDNA